MTEMWSDEPLLYSKCITWAKNKLLDIIKTSDDFDDFKGFCEFKEQYNLYNEEELENARERLKELADSEIDYIENERPIESDMEDKISDLKYFSSVLELDIEEELENAKEWIREPEYPEDDREYSSHDDRPNRGIEDEEIRQMFETLMGV